MLSLKKNNLKVAWGIDQRLRRTKEAAKKSRVSDRKNFFSVTRCVK